MMNSDKNIIALHRWWTGQLQQITTKVMLDEEKRQAKAAKKASDALADYRNRDEIIDAYGFGFISERKKDKLLDLWDEREQASYPEELYQMKLNLLRELYEVSKNISDGR